MIHRTVTSLLACILVAGAAGLSCAHNSQATVEHDAIPTAEERRQAGQEQPQSRQAAGGGEGTDGDSARSDWWGPIQGRADDAHEELEEEIERCLTTLGGPDRVREIGLVAEQGDGWLAGYELQEVTSFPGEPDGRPCVQRIAEQYVEEVGASVWDDFDTYTATFVHRGNAVEPGGCQQADETSCTGLDVEADGAGDESTGDECPGRFVGEIETALNEQRQCWRGRIALDRQGEYEDEILEQRAVIFGDVVVEDGNTHLLLHYNRPWVEQMTSCAVDELDDSELGVQAPAGDCRAALSNRAVTLWFGPAFTYMFE